MRAIPVDRIVWALYHETNKFNDFCDRAEPALAVSASGAVDPVSRIYEPRRLVICPHGRSAGWYWSPSTQTDSPGWRLWQAKEEGWLVEPWPETP